MAMQLLMSFPPKASFCQLSMGSAPEDLMLLVVLLEAAGRESACNAF
jgi:hypothetical protein